MENYHNKKQKPILFTGITPTGTLTLGHYFGVIRHLLNLQNDYQIYLMIADLHALTTITDKKIDYKGKTKEIASLIYACGLREENCKVFVQSSISSHLELSHYLSSYCSIGKLNNMIQYKEKSREKKNPSFSLLSYPVLMASDILLYDADLVIVGKDQKQHLELTEYLANKFNSDNNNCLKIPNFSIPKLGSKIMGLKNPEKKMSKSGSDYISLMDSEEVVNNKIMKAETDSEGKIFFDEEKKPGISNLLTIYSCLKNISIDEAEAIFVNSNYSYLKSVTSNYVCELLNEIGNEFKIYNSKIDEILNNNNLEIYKISEIKLKKIRKELNIWNF
ncbi:MAG: Tryptophan--tRNA ligase [Mycoplasmataceae bacterium]|nr:MAG: Tryptophan--tRNA ligase [Mycoplasmataceae bacterium]